MGGLHRTSHSPSYSHLGGFGANEPLAEINSQTIYRCFLGKTIDLTIWHFKIKLYPVEKIEKNNLSATILLSVCIKTEF